MDDFSHLHTLTDDAFNAERTRIIAEFINSAPPEFRMKLLAIQYRLDMIRSKSTPEEFMQALIVEMGESLTNMSDQMQTVCHVAGARPVAPTFEAAPKFDFSPYTLKKSL